MWKRKLGLCILLYLVSTANIAATIYHLGVPPYYDYPFTRHLLYDHNQFIENFLDVEIDLISQGNFRTFIQSAVNQEFDIIAASPHIVAYLVDAHGYQPLVQWSSRHQITITTKASQKIHKLNDLKGRRIALTDPLSLLSIIATDILIEYNLAPPINSVPVYTKFDQALMKLLNGEVDAAFTLKSDIDKLSTQMQKKLVILHRLYLPELPLVIYAAAPNMDKKHVNNIKKSLFSFEKSEIGQRFFQRIGGVGLEDVNPDALIKYREYSRILYELNFQTLNPDQPVKTSSGK